MFPKTVLASKMLSAHRGRCDLLSNRCVTSKQIKLQELCTSVEIDEQGICNGNQKLNNLETEDLCTEDSDCENGKCQYPYYTQLGISKKGTASLSETGRKICIRGKGGGAASVSYTHLTLPTILLV